MGGLRRNKDSVGLTLAWAILVQAIVFSFTSGLHAATLASGAGGSAVLCSVRAPGGEQPPEQVPAHQADLQCCATACRLSCAGTMAGILPETSRVPLPAPAFARSHPPRLDAPALKSTLAHAARPRAPPPV